MLYIGRMISMLGKHTLLKNLIPYGVLLLLVVYTLVKGIIPAWQALHSDFPNYYLSARIVIEGKDTGRLYDDDWFNRQLQLKGLAEQGKFSPFPPATAYVLLPVAYLPPLTAKRVWTVCNVFFLFFGITLLQKITGWKWVSCAVIVFLIGQGLINNFRLGQVYLLVFCVIVLSHYLIKRGQSGIAGSLLGIVAVIKYFPIVFVAGYGLAGNKRLVVYALSTIIFLVIVQIQLLGLDLFTAYVSEVFVSHMQGNLSMQSPYAIAFQSWESLLRNIFVADPVDNPYPVLNFPKGKWIVQGLIYSIIISTTGYVLWQTHLLQKHVKLWVYLSLPALGALVLSPASATYHYLLLIFPFSCILAILKWYHASIWVMGWFLCLYIGIGWVNFNHVQAIAEPEGWGILLFYPRLWLLLVLYFSYVWIIYQRLIKERKQPDLLVK